MDFPCFPAIQVGPSHNSESRASWVWNSAQWGHSLWTRDLPLELEPAPLWVLSCLCEHTFPFPFLGKPSGEYISSASPKGTEVLGVYTGV